MAVVSITIASRALRSSYGMHCRKRTQARAHCQLNGVEVSFTEPAARLLGAPYSGTATGRRLAALGAVASV